MGLGVKRSTIPITILSGQSLSAAAADLGESRLIGIEMPAAWTAAALSFQGSEDGVTFRDMFGVLAELQVASAASAAGQYVALDTLGGAPAATTPLATNIKDAFPRFVKIRSGLTAAPVAQGADRILKLIIQTEG